MGNRSLARAHAVIGTAAKRCARSIQATSTNIAGDVAAARHLVPPEVSVAAYVNLLAPIAPDDFDEHASRLLKAGADELHLYHFGLANPERLPLFSRLTSTWR